MRARVTSAPWLGVQLPVTTSEQLVDPDAAQPGHPGDLSLGDPELDRSREQLGDRRHLRAIGLAGRQTTSTVGFELSQQARRLVFHRSAVYVRPMLVQCVP